MALFWHNHFATAYSKIAGAVGQERATRMMDNDPGSLAGSLPGQIQTLRQHATGSFPTMLMAMAKDPAMIYWLDSQLNTRTRPQENFGREIMELFSLGIGNYTEQDVYAAARVFTGFNWQIVGDRASTTQSFYAFQYRPNDHDTAAKDVHVPDLYGRRPRHSGARGRKRRTGRGRPDLRAGPASGNRAAPGDAAVQVFRERNRGTRSGAGQRHGERVPGQQLQHQGDAAHDGPVVAVPQPGQLLPALFVAGRIRDPRHQGNRLDRTLGADRVDAAHQHGPAALRAAGRQRLGARDRDGFRPRRCWRA